MTKAEECSKKVREDGGYVTNKFFKDRPVDKLKLPYALVKATEAIDIWSFGVILYMLFTGSPLFDVNRDDDINTPEAMEELFEWNLDKKKAKLEKVNDPLARKLLMKILSINPPDRYQSMDDLLKDEYFGSGNSDHLTHLTKPADNTSPAPGLADNTSSDAPPEPGLAGFTIPSRIGVSESNELQQQIQNRVPTDFDHFYPKVIISYATGWRPTSDVEGAGPGMFIAAAVIEALFKSEIPCFSGLMTQAGNNWEEYFLRLEHTNAKVLVALLSKAFFQSLPCLKEVHDAIQNKLVIIPVRVEESGGRASDIARDMESMWPDAMIEKYVRSDSKNENVYWTTLKQTKLQRLRVKNALKTMNTLPARGSLLTDSNALKELISQVQGILTEHPRRRRAEDSHSNQILNGGKKRKKVADVPVTNAQLRDKAVRRISSR